jgi:DNA-binding MarR family transcriptional regulator
LGQFATALFAQRIAHTGLRPNLAGLLSLAAAQPDASQLDLGTAFGVGASAVVPLVDELEDKGLVRRERDSADRRRQRLRVTEAGFQALSVVSEEAVEVGTVLLAGLDPQERRTFADLLAKIPFERQ